jgi:hypothetical protein
LIAKPQNANLVCPNYKIKIMLDQKVVNNISAKSVRNSSRIFCPTTDVWIRVTPQEIAKQTFGGQANCYTN